MTLEPSLFFCVCVAYFRVSVLLVGLKSEQTSRVKTGAVPDAQTHSGFFFFLKKKTHKRFENLVELL